MTTRDEAERALRAAGAGPDEGFPLLEAAIACALHEAPGRDASRVRALAAEAADRLQARLKRAPPEEALAEVLSGELRYAGDLITYDSLENADILSVCARRRGLPVALGLLYLDAARRCGLAVHGVDFPGHFLLRVEADEGPLAIDPFSQGRIVTAPELSRRALLAGLDADAVERIDLLMTPISDRAVLIRLQNNIFARASQAGDHPRAERSALRRALIDPADPAPWLDVATARESQGALTGALQALALAQPLDGEAALAARAARARVRLKLN
jgi:regulator of sirC expression with transglutaminase-like and TPR domain